MRTAMSGLALVAPRSVDHALRLMRDAPAGALVPLAGCTDLFVAANAGTLSGTTFLDLWALDDLRGIGMNRGSVAIGALTTFTRITNSSLVRRRLPALAAAAAEIGGVQIQNRATIGGNIANASPAGDSLPVLAALDAAVVLRRAAGIRRVPIAEFYLGYRRTAMQPGELIVAVEIPLVPGTQWFRKVGTRAAQAISKVVMCAVVIRAARTERALAEGASIDEAAAVLTSEISPIDDTRSTAEYRRRVSANLLRRFWADTARSRP
jgi:xanthine dehydrogenase small subunit